MGPENLVPEMKAVVEEVLKSYPEKTAKNRAKHLGVGSPDDETKTCAGVQSNKKTAAFPSPAHRKALYFS